MKLFVALLWKIFGNDDDWPPPEWYMPGEKMWKRKLYWLIRNPLHNFTFYCIGVAGKPFSRTGKFPVDVFSPKGGWNWAVTKYKWTRLPFVSYLGRSVKFYIGWRERGNFGFKFTGRGGLMKVIASKGTRCPKEGNPRDYIDDSVPQEVPESAYYMRLIDDGSLIRVAEKVQTGKEGKR